MKKKYFDWLSIFIIVKEKAFFQQITVNFTKYEPSSFFRGFSKYQSTINEYNNLQISKEKCSLIKINNKNISIMLTLNRFHTFFLSAVGAGKECCECFLLKYFSCNVSYTYLHLQQKHLLSHMKIGVQVKLLRDNLI